MNVLFKKDLKRLLGGIRGCASIALLLLICGAYTFFYNMLMGFSDFSYVLSASFPALVLTLPILSATAFSCEGQGAMGHLYSLGITPTRILLGKYLAKLTVFAIPTAILSLYPLLLSFFGDVEMGQTYFAILGYFLLGAALLAVTLFFSALFGSAWVAWGVSTGVLLFLYLSQLFITSLPAAAWFSFVVVEVVLLAIGVLLWLWLKEIAVTAIYAILPVGVGVLFLLFSDKFASLVPAMLSKINPFARYSGFVYGRFDLEGILFYLSAAALFLVLTLLLLVYRRDDEI